MAKNKDIENMIKQKGYLLVEVLISMLIFSVLVSVIAVFLKRVAIIENVKKNSQKMDENIYFALEKVKVELEDRDLEEFDYSGEKTNLFVRGNQIIYWKNRIFYKLEIVNKKLYISEVSGFPNFGNRSLIGEYEDINFEKIGGILAIKSKYLGKSEIIILSI